MTGTPFYDGVVPELEDGRRPVGMGSMFYEWAISR
jgi:hypothetical protein